MQSNNSLFKGRSAFCTCLLLIMFINAVKLNSVQITRDRDFELQVYFCTHFDSVISKATQMLGFNLIQYHHGSNPLGVCVLCSAYVLFI